MNIRKIFKVIFHSIKRHNEKSKVSEIFHDVERIPTTLYTGISNKVKKLKISNVNWGIAIKFVVMICIVGFFFILPTYAQDATTNTGLSATQDFLNKILAICSRGWIILAVLAGKLMTNDRVYGSILHMDIYLWKIRNIIKNFANFTLVAIILGTIINNLIGKKGMDIKQLITKTLIAGVLIQASWFLVGALVDVSTILVSAVGAFPSSFLQQDANLKGKMVSSLIKTNTKYLIDLSTGNIITPIGTDVDQSTATSQIDQLLPTYNSVSGPLIYLGMSVFKFQNYLNTEGSPGAESLTISFLLRFVLIFFYTMGLALLFIANIIRVVFMRIFIIGSPFIVLFTLFKDMLGGKEGGKGIGSYMNFEVMIEMVFKPVIFVAGFSLILILVVSIQSIMNGTIPKSFNGVEIGINSGSSTLSITDISTIEVQENGIFGKDSTTGETITDISQTIFVNLIIFFMTIFLMRQFIKMAVTSGKGPIGKIMTPMVGWLEKTAKTLPILPIAGGMSIGAAQKFSEGQQKKLAEGFGMNTEGKFTDAEASFNQYVSDKFGILSAWNDKDYDLLDKTITSGGDFVGKSIDIAGKRQGGLTLNDSRRKDKLDKYFKTGAGKDELKKRGFKGASSYKDFEKFFNGDNQSARTNRRLLHERLGGDTEAYPSRSTSAASPPSYENLTSNAYHKNAKERSGESAPEETKTNQEAETSEETQ